MMQKIVSHPPEKVTEAVSLSSNNAFLLKVVDELLAFVSIISPEGKMIEINSAVVQATGMPRESLLGTYVWESPAIAFSDKAQARIKEAYKIAASGKKHRYLEEYKHADGEMRWVDLTFSPIFENGELKHIVGSGMDVTELIKQTQELKRVEQEFQWLAESIPQKIWIRKENGEKLYYNQRWIEYTGFDDETSGYSWQQSLHPDDLDRTAAIWNQSIKTGLPYEAEYRLRRHDGEYRWHLARGVLYQDHTNQTKKWFGTATDIHDQKQTEYELKQLSENLERVVEKRTAELVSMNRELEAFSYSVSHDLRTPLRSIEGFSQAVLEDETDKLSERAVKDLKRVVDASQFMGRLIDDLLKLSRLSRREVRKEPVSLTALVEKIVQQKRTEFPDRQVEVSIQPVPDVVGDAGLLELALENLVSNAWKFTQKTPAAKIEIGSEEVDGNFSFYVKDNGVGFDMAYYDKLFGAFQRLHKASEFTGTGVGLATVRRIIHRHGGKVWAKAAINEGAKFSFSITNQPVLEFNTNERSR